MIFPEKAETVAHAFSGRTCRALIVTGETGQLQYYRAVAPRLIKRGVSVSFCCDRDDPGVAEAVKAAAAEAGAAFFHHQGDRGPPDGPLSVSRAGSPLWNWLRAKLCRPKQALEFDAKTGAPHAQLEAMRSYHAYRLQDAERVLREARPDLVVLGEDGIAADFWAITAAKARNVPVVVLPYGMADSSSLVWKGLEQKSREDSIFTADSPGGAYIARHYPHWFKETKFGRTLYFAPSYIIALEEHDICIPNPWCFQGGSGDLILIEGREMQERYSAEGVASDKVAPVGAVYSDVIREVFDSDERYRAAFERKDPIQSGVLRVLVCVPSSEVPSWQVDREFKSIDAFLMALRSAFGSIPAIQPTYSFHPRMAATDRARLGSLGFESDSEFVVSLIAKHDVIITCHSSVTRWALVAGKPVIDFDLQNFKSNFFPHCAGFKFCSAFSEVEALLRRLANDPYHYRSLAASAADFGKRFGPVDGHAADRIATALKALASGASAAEVRAVVPAIGSRQAAI